MLEIMNDLNFDDSHSNQYYHNGNDNENNDIHRIESNESNHNNYNFSANQGRSFNSSDKGCDSFHCCIL